MTKKTIARRIALLSSSSLGLAAIASAASLGMALAPTTAAAAVVCAATTTVTGNGTDTVTIAGGTNNPGITCAYTGTAGTVTTLGAVTVSTTAGGTGIDLTGGAADAINWTSTAAPAFSAAVVGGSQTNGPVIDAQTGGAITLTTGNVSVNPGGTDGIFARSTNGGNVTLTTGSVGFGNAVGSTAIEAISNGGNIAVTTTGAVGNIVNNLANNSANHDGLVAQTSGAGAVTLDLRNAVTGLGPNGAAVRVINGTGDVFINATSAVRGGGSNSTSEAQFGAGFNIDSDGDVVVNSTSLIMGAINAVGARQAAIIASGDTFTLTLTGDLNVAADNFPDYRASLGGYFVAGGFNLGATGGIGSQIQRLSTHIGGHVDLSGVTGGAELNFNDRSRWMLEETSLMSPGDDVVNLDATSVLMTTFSHTGAQYDNGINIGSSADLDADQTWIRPGVIEFGEGVDTFNNAGRMLIGPAYSGVSGVGTGPDRPPLADVRFGIRGEVQMLDLEQFNNSGEIWLGPMIFGPSVPRTDGWRDDMLYMPGATFHGEEGSVIIMDVDLNNTQSSCAPSTRDSQGYLPAADCMGLQGGAATGRTELRIVEVIPGDRGIYNPDGLVLVDLAGGDPAATDPDAFFLSPDTPRYLDIGNGGIEKGVFAYILGFDADTQQFKLVGAPSSGAQQFPILATAANQLWQTATGGWFQRRVHQRDVGHEGLGTGAWFNVTGMGTERDISTSVAIGTDDVVFDNSYEQSDVAISFGWDLLDYGNDAALGAMVGYAHSEVEFDDSDNSANLEGVHAGLYGGYGAGGFFIDGAINAAILSLHNDVPAMDLQPTGTVLDTEVWSLGGRVEAGWRFNALGGLWLEPLVGASAVSTSFEDIRVPNGDPDPNRPGVNVRLDSAESRRASAGLRFGVTDMWANVAPTSFSLTARAVNEFEGGADVSVENVGPTYLSTDTLEGNFTQVTGSVSVSSPDKAISGYLNLDTVKGDDYDSLGASIGVRLHW